MAVKLVFKNELSGQVKKISMKCKKCKVINLCSNPFRIHCIACGERFPNKFQYMPNFCTARHSYYSTGVT